MLDPPVQTQLRGLVGKGFTPRRVAALEDGIRTFVRSLLADFGPETDLHRDFSTRIPTFVLAELLGVPEADRAQFDPWVSALTALQDDGFAPTAVDRSRGRGGDVRVLRRRHRGPPATRRTT